jgi:ABC-type glycerol-3-phosphate transport system substrate-binding protein
LTFAKNFYAYALANYARWSVPSPQTMLETAITAFESALAAFANPNRGKVDTLNKNEAKAALTHALRAYAQGFVARNPAVTDEDKEQMSRPLVHAPQGARSGTGAADLLAGRWFSRRRRCQGSTDYNW